MTDTLKQTISDHVQHIEDGDYIDIYLRRDAFTILEMIRPMLFFSVQHDCLSTTDLGTFQVSRMKLTLAEVSQDENDG